MNLVSSVDLIFSLSIFLALIFLFTGWKRALRIDVKLVLVGLLIAIFFRSVIGFLEWTSLTIERLDFSSDFVATLQPILWISFLYTFLQQVYDQRKEHLNALLRSISNINQLLVKEDDKKSLIEKTCDELFETREFIHVWIALLDETNELVGTAASGLEGKLEPLKEAIESDSRPEKIEEVLDEAGTLVTKEFSGFCEDCPLAEECEEGTTITSRIDYDSRIYGLLSGCLPKNYVNEKEVSLLEDVTDDIAFGLHDIGVQEDLQESERKYRSLFNSIRDAILVADTDRNIIDCNPAFTELFGYDLEEIKGKKTEYLYHEEEEYEVMEEKIEESIKDPNFLYTIHYEKKNGKVFPGETNSFYLKDDEDEVVGFIGLIRDVTEKLERQRELKRSERRYRTLFETTGTAMLIFEEDTSISLANKEVENLTGYSKEEIEGTSWTEFVAREDQLEKMKRYHSLRLEDPGSAPNQYEFKLLDKDGNERDVLMTVDVILGTKKSVASIMDITERREALERLEKQKSEKSILLRNLPGMAYRCENDRDWTMRFVSDGCEELTGYKPEELVDNSINSYGDLIVKEDRQMVWEEVQSHLKNRQPFKIEYRIRTKEGKLKWVWERGRGVFDEAEQLKNIQGIITDVTERKNIEFDLKKSEEKFRSYVENAPIGVYVVDGNGNYIEVNEAACEMTGYSREEMLTMEFSDVVTPDTVDEAQEAFKELLDQGEAQEELHYLTKNGTKRHMVVNAVRVTDDRYLGFALDITERKKAEKELEQATLETLQALNKTIEAKDEYTGQHIDRVQKLSMKIGEELGLSKERLEQLRYASILHDIGKIGVPDSILGKPDELTEEEWVQMEKHPEIGERIVGRVDRLNRAAKIIGQHQERYDGSGYPQGLEVEEITLEARIVAVADAWDAMRTDRPYRKALPKEEAVKELKENAGTQFDPEIVNILLEIIREDKVKFESD